MNQKRENSSSIGLLLEVKKLALFKDLDRSCAQAQHIYRYTYRYACPGQDRSGRSLPQ